MKKILGLDLGTTSIGWAMVNEAEDASENSSIIRLGVRVIPLTTDEHGNFEKGKAITTNADRTLKRGMRRNLQRYKQRREKLIAILKKEGWITDQTFLFEKGNNTTFQTYRLRDKAATEQVSLEELARVLLMINKKRGYKSNRKTKSANEGQPIDDKEVARKLRDEGLTPGQFVYRELSKEQKKCHVPDFYCSDLEDELDRIWKFQGQYHPEILTIDFRKQIEGKNEKKTVESFSSEYQIDPVEIKERGNKRTREIYVLREKSLKEELSREELAFVVSNVNGQICSSNSYLGNISNRSKELYFKEQTVGQALMEKLNADSNVSLRNQPFYRQDYLDEFDKIWSTQAQFYPQQLTPELRHEIRDCVIFYQRRLKSQKGLVRNCQFEQWHKVCPKSSPLFQTFKILQAINNIKLTTPEGERLLEEDERKILYNELCYRAKLSAKEVLKLLFPKGKDFEINYEEIEGNCTMAALLKACQNVIAMSGHGEYNFAKGSANKSLKIIQEVFGGLGYAIDWLTLDFDKKDLNLDKEPQYRLWHLLYSYEGDSSPTGDKKLVEHLVELLNLPDEYAKVFSRITFQDGYGNLSTKAIRKVLPFLFKGQKYNEACDSVGYRHSPTSLTSEELANRELKDHLELLPKNALRNPVVEKILNQMVHVVNHVIDEYGPLDEVRIELARELKQSAAKREEASKQISDNTKEQKRITNLLQGEGFNLGHVSRNDIIRYRLYEELEKNGYKTLYSNIYIPKEKIFSKEIDIEHIIPQSCLFDDSFSNKTLEYRNVNIKKGSATAYDYVASKYGEKGVEEYLNRVDNLLKNKAISKAKAKKLKMKKEDIPTNFIERDLRNTQYIACEAQKMLRQVVRTVTATTGSITSRLREDWQLVDVMKDLNWDKYNRQRLTEIIDGRDGQRIRQINNWSKRNDHRHHAVDALAVAFTKPSYIQYLNKHNARSNDSSSIREIEQKELYRNKRHRLLFVAPITPAKAFRREAKRQLENILISIKAKNKVVTRNTNKSKKKEGYNKVTQLTPRGQLHKETVCSQMKVPCPKTVSIGAKMDAAMIKMVQNPNYRIALQKRLDEFGGDAKKAFTGKNKLDKNPIWIAHNHAVPKNVTILEYEDQYTVRKPITKDFKLDKVEVVDKGIRDILQSRLNEYDGDAAKAFSNLDKNPIFFNREKGICIKSVRCKLLNNAIPLHSRLDKEGDSIPIDYVSTGNNHHVAIFRDSEGDFQEHVVSFYEATERARQKLPIIDKEYKREEGWQFCFTLKQNEYFVFPNADTGFDPNEVDLKCEKNYVRISHNLYRVQKITKGDYYFRHHLETNVEEVKELKDQTWKRITRLNDLDRIVKVRVNHLGKIVDVGEY